MAADMGFPAKVPLRPMLYGVSLLAATLPLWAGRTLPLVDLPQHLHLISVLHRLNDPTTLYPSVYTTRGELTPYLGYYHAVSLLHWLMPLEIANKAFLSLYVVGMALSLAFLLRSLGRPAWPSLLALPFAYGDSFAWGFLNFCAAIPLAFLTCGLFVRCLNPPANHAMRWAMALAVSLVIVLLFHIQMFAFLGLALPALWLMTGRPWTRWGAWLKDSRLALFAVSPAVCLFGVWVVGRLGQPTDIQYGAPWKAWGPLLSKENLSYKSLDQNRAELLQVLANHLRDGSDRRVLSAIALTVILAWAISFWPGARGTRRESRVEAARLPVLLGIALILYFTLPFDIRGYIYYLNTRYAHVAAALAVCCIPPLHARIRGYALLTASACTLLLVYPLTTAFRTFDREAEPLERIALSVTPKPRVMGLIYNASSSVVNHPVFLHSAAVVARERGGLPNYSFALTPHSPLQYRGTPPPTFPSEWRPQDFDLKTQAPAYDHFLIRGNSAERIFGGLLQSSFQITAIEGPFTLVTRH